jgi:hypothetical protein
MAQNQKSNGRQSGNLANQSQKKEPNAGSGAFNRGSKQDSGQDFNSEEEIDGNKADQNNPGAQAGNSRGNRVKMSNTAEDVETEETDTEGTLPERDLDDANEIDVDEESDEEFEEGDEETDEESEEDTDEESDEDGDTNRRKRGK